VSPPGLLVLQKRMRLLKYLDYIDLGFGCKRPRQRLVRGIPNRRGILPRRLAAHSRSLDRMAAKVTVELFLHLWRGIHPMTP
jgi:hypothetical protein